jgi:hypothetical protein
MCRVTYPNKSSLFLMLSITCFVLAHTHTHTHTHTQVVCKHNCTVSENAFQWIFKKNMSKLRSGAFVWVTALQAWRSRFRFLKVSSEFFFESFRPHCNIYEYRNISWEGGGKKQLWVRLTNYHLAYCLEICKPQAGLCRNCLIFFMSPSY